MTPQSDLRLNTPELRVDINRDKLGDLGIPVETVGRTLQTMLGGSQITRFKKDGEQYDVIVQVAPRDRSRPNDISDIYVRGARWFDGAAGERGRRCSKASRLHRSITFSGCAR